LRRPFSGWLCPHDDAREHNVILPLLRGRHLALNFCQLRCARGSTLAFSQFTPPSVLTSTLSTG